VLAINGVYFESLNFNDASVSYNKAVDNIKISVSSGVFQSLLRLFAQQLGSTTLLSVNVSAVPSGTDYNYHLNFISMRLITFYLYFTKFLPQFTQKLLLLKVRQNLSRIQVPLLRVLLLLS